MPTGAVANHEVRDLNPIHCPHPYSRPSTRPHHRGEEAAAEPPSYSVQLPSDSVDGTRSPRACSKCLVPVRRLKRAADPVTLRYQEALRAAPACRDGGADSAPRELT